MSNTKKALKVTKVNTPVEKVTEVNTPVTEVTESATVLTISKVENPGKKFTTLEAKIELKAETKLKMTQANPKRPSSKIYGKYETYKTATTISEYSEKFGAGWQAGVKYDYQHGFLTLSK